MRRRGGALPTTIALGALAATLLIGATIAAAADPLLEEIDRRAAASNPRVVEWRRDIHQNPELSNREFRTSKLVAEHLAKLGLEVKTGVAHTGVIGLLRGAASEPVVALRADMDALPVTEQVDVPFASRARDTYNGRDVGVMHVAATTPTWRFCWALPRFWRACARGSPAP